MVDSGALYHVVELFCGCGGFSSGFARTGRFSVELGSDINEVFCQTFQKNHVNETGAAPRVVVGHIGEIKDCLEKAFKDLGYLNGKNLDVLLGGPPCEGFSQNKRSKTRDPQSGKVRYGGYKQSINDPRNFLVLEFIRAVAKLKPKIVIIENVPQILTHDEGRFRAEIVSRLQSLGYRVDCAKLNAADFGVPQLRKRAFFWAIRKDLLKQAAWPALPPFPTHRPANGRDLFGSNPTPTVQDAMADLPASSDREEGGKPPNHYPGLPHLSEYARSLRSRTATPYNHVHRTVRESALQRLKKMKPGMRLEDLPKHLRTKSWYFNCYGRLAWDGYARTITKSCNYVGSGCFGHPDQDRGITMREAARLQSFQDDFRFWSDSEHQVAQMVGGAVPPLLAEAIARPILKFLDSSAPILSHAHDAQRGHLQVRMATG